MADFAVSDIFDEIDRQAALFGVNPRTAKALVVAENTGSGSVKGRASYSGDAVSSAGARGLMQVMPDTAKGLQKAGFLPLDWKHDPSNLSSQVQAGLAALKEKTGRMNSPDDLAEVASVYNGSSKTHQAYKAGNFAALPDETKQYIAKLRRADMELGGQRVNNPSAYTGNAAESPAASSPPSSGSSRTTTRSTSYDQGLLDSFNTAIGAATAPGGSLDRTVSTIRQQADARELMNQDVINAVAAQGKAAGEEASATAIQAAANQARRLQILTKFNLNPDVTNDRASKAFDIVNAADLEMDAMRPEIQQRMSVGIFDNPIEWLVNQVRLPGMVGTYNGVAKQKEAAVTHFKTAADIASTQMTVSDAMDADLILRRGVATANRIAATATMDAAKVKADNAGALQRDELVIAQLQGQKIDLIGKAVAKTAQTDSMSEGTSERQQVKDFEKATLDGVNQMLAMVEAKPLKSIMELKTMPKVDQDRLLTAARSGKFGAEFSNSFQMLLGDGNPEMFAAKGGTTPLKWVRGTAGMAGKIVDDIDKLPTNDPARPKNYNPQKELPGELDAIQRRYQQQGNTDMRTASEHNPLKLDYSVASKDPALAANEVAVWINKYGPKGTNPMMTTVDEQFIMNKFAQAVGSGTMTAGQAAKAIEDFYKQATAKQAVLTQYTLFGMAKPEKTYPVVIGGYGTDKPIDLGNRAEIERSLMTKITKDKAAAALDETSGFPVRTIFFGLGANQ